MSSRILAIAIDCHDADALAAFWSDALGDRIGKRWTDADGLEYIEVGDDPILLFQPVPEGKQVKNRLHLDLAPSDGDQTAEVRRLQGLGASVLADEARFPWVVLADPEGNEFCVLPAR